MGCIGWAMPKPSPVFGRRSHQMSLTHCGLCHRRAQSFSPNLGGGGSTGTLGRASQLWLCLPGWEDALVPGEGATRLGGALQGSPPARPARALEGFENSLQHPPGARRRGRGLRRQIPWDQSGKAKALRSLSPLPHPAAGGAQAAPGPGKPRRVSIRPSAWHQCPRGALRALLLGACFFHLAVKKSAWLA